MLISVNLKAFNGLRICIPISFRLISARQFIIRSSLPKFGLPCDMIHLQLSLSRSRSNRINALAVVTYSILDLSCRVLSTTLGIGIQNIKTIMIFRDWIGTFEEHKGNYGMP